MTGEPKRLFPAVERVLRPDAATEPLLRGLLGELEDLGCQLTPPGGVQRNDYVNVTPLRQRGRIVSLHAASGRSEFQADSWDRIGHLGGRFVHLEAGNKAVHPLSSVSDVRAIVEAAKIEIAFRGGRRSR